MAAGGRRARGLGAVGEGLVTGRVAVIRRGTLVGLLFADRARLVAAVRIGGRASGRGTASVEVGVQSAHLLLSPVLPLDTLGEETLVVGPLGRSNGQVVLPPELLPLLGGLVAVDLELGLDLCALLAGLFALLLLLDLHLGLSLTVEGESLDVVLGDAHGEAESWRLEERSAFAPPRGYSNS